MFKMDIKPRIATIESGAVVEHKKTTNKGFIIESMKGNFDILTYKDNGRLVVTDTDYTKDDCGLFFSNYKIIAQRDEYTAFLRE